MRSAVSTLEVLRPKNLTQALRSLADNRGADRLLPLAGGTDLFVYLNSGTPPGRRYLDLGRVAELRGVAIGRDAATIGARITFRELRDHAAIARRLPSLAAAAAEVGGWQIQNRATLAGNVANASPAGDSLPVLLAHDAVVLVRSVRGTREIAFDSLYRGYRDLAMEKDELITAVRLPFAPARSFAFFRKVGTRRAQSISKVVFAGCIGVAKEGRVSHVRLAFGSVGPVTLRARNTEGTLLGERATRATAERAVAAIASDLSPIDDIRSTREYRLEVAANLLAQFLRAADPRFSR